MKTAWAALAAALVASVCCTGPVLSVALGAGTIGALAVGFQPVRPLFLLIALSLLAVAFYRAYGPATRVCSLEGRCEPGARGRLLVWFVSVIVVLLIAFPYYASAPNGGPAIPATPSSAADLDEEMAPVPSAIETSTLTVAGMSCGGCATAVRNAVGKIDGVKSVEVDVEAGRAVVAYDPAKTNPSAIAQTITELSGFPTEVLREASRANPAR